MSASKLDLLGAVQELSFNSPKHDNCNRIPKRKNVSLGNYLDSTKKRNPNMYDLRPKQKKESHVASIEIFAAELDAEADLRFKEFMEDAKSANAKFNDDDTEFSDLEDNIDFDDMTCELFSFLDGKENGSIRSGRSQNRKKKASKSHFSSVDLSSSHRKLNDPPKKTRKSFPFGSVTPVEAPRNGKPFSPPLTPKGVLTPRNGNNYNMSHSPVNAGTPKHRLSSNAGTPKSLLSPGRNRSFSAFPSQENIIPSSAFSISDNLDNSPTAMSTPRSKESAPSLAFQDVGPTAVSTPRSKASAPSLAPQDDESIELGSRTSIENNIPGTFASPLGHPIDYNRNDPKDPCSSAYRLWKKKGLMSNERKTETTRPVPVSPKMPSESSIFASPFYNLKNSEIDLSMEEEEKGMSSLDHSKSVSSIVSLSRPGLPVWCDPDDHNNEVVKAYKVWSDMGLMITKEEKELGFQHRRTRRKKSSNKPKDDIGTPKKGLDKAPPGSVEKVVEELDWEKFLSSLPAAPDDIGTNSHKKQASNEFSAVLDSWNCRDGQYELLHGGILTPLKESRNKRLFKEWKKRTATIAIEEEASTSTTVATTTATCLCSDPTLHSSEGIVEFFLPDLGMTTCTCGKKQKDLFVNKDDPTSLVNILRPWQVDFLENFGIRRGDQLVKAHHRSANVLSKAMRSYRKMHHMAPVRTLSCGMALHIWARTCKVYVRTIRRQIRKEMPLKPPSILSVLSTFLGKVALPEERRLSNRHHSARLLMESQGTVEI